jgi:hypothetical protein
MSRLYAVAAIAVALGFVSIAATEQVAAAPSKASLEQRARQAVAPLAVESAFCVRLSRTIAVCALRHPDAGGLHCRSTVVVRGRRVRVIQSNHCFEVREVTP